MILPIIAILPVKNESSRISATLSYYEACLNDIPLYIVDAFSSDETLSVCRKHSINSTCQLCILQKDNHGTTEDPEWMRWLVDAIPSESYIFLSCSEFISVSVLNDIKIKQKLNYDLAFYHRRSTLWGRNVSAVYSGIGDLILFRTTFRPICRFASARALTIVSTRIHDNWISQSDLVKSVFVRDKSLEILHCKNPCISSNLRKHYDYARVEAGVDRRIPMHFMRFFREIVYVLLLALTLRLSRACFVELLMRISYRAAIICLILESNDN
jgi:hypothetical protein